MSRWTVLWKYVLLTNLIGETPGCFGEAGVEHAAQLSKNSGTFKTVKAKFWP